MANSHQAAPPHHAPTNFTPDHQCEEGIRFLKAETREATIDALRGCDCPKCRDVRADDGPECGSLTGRAKR